MGRLLDFSDPSGRNPEVSGVFYTSRSEKRFSFKRVSLSGAKLLEGK
jgi:hypothetical protein